jgi:outer membrane protein assembly factor BamB
MNFFSRKSLPFFAVASLLAAQSCPAADWPHYRGPKWDGSSPEKILSHWPEGGPKALWKTTTTDGFSSFAIAGERAYTLVASTIDGVKQEVCVAFDAKSGKQLWTAPLGVFKVDGGGDDGEASNKGGDGPRSTPTIDGDRVYVMSSRLVLNCFDAATGKSVWEHDLIKDYAGKNISWHNAASPLVEGNLVLVCGGGDDQALLGFNKKSGEVVWKGESDKMTHATPVAGTILGQRQVIFFTQKGLVSVVPETGKVLWRYAFPYKVSTAASPVIAEDRVYCAAGYGVGSALVKITKEGDNFTATELWRLSGNEPVANHWSTPVYKDGHLYGMFSFKKYGNGALKCVEVATGAVKWEQSGFGAGNVILVEKSILALTDKGEIVLVETNPSAYKEISRAKVVDGKCWSTPSLSNGRLFIRSTKEAVCLDVAEKTAESK